MTPRSFSVPVAVALATLPWLFPFSPGPSPTVVPWLTSFACALALWLLALASGARPSGRLAALAAALVLVAWLPHPGTFHEVVFLAGGLALLTIAASLAEDPDISAALQRGLLLAAAASAVFGLCQYFGISQRLAPWVNFAEPGLAYGNLRQPNQFASLCWLGMAVLLWGAPALPRALAVSLAVLLAVASAASVSRTGMLQGLLLLLLALAWPGPQRRGRIVLCAVAGAAYFVASLALPLLLQAGGMEPPRTLLERLGGVQACSSRIVLWSNVLHATAQQPLLGWGWGELDYAHFMTFYPGERFCEILDNAHNLPLHLAVELGVPAALVVCGGFVWWMVRQRPWREQDGRRQLAWAILAVVLLHSLLEYPLWYGPFQIAVGASVGWLLAPASAPASPRPAMRLPLAALAVVLLGATGYAAWDYARVSQIYLPPEQRLPQWREDTAEQAHRSWLFASQAGFAELTLAAVTRDNAEPMYALSQEMLHYSPEPRVIERLIESATQLGREDEAVLYLARYRAAFPRNYETWRQPQQGLRAP